MSFVAGFGRCDPCHFLDHVALCEFDLVRALDDEVVFLDLDAAGLEAESARRQGAAAHLVVEIDAVCYHFLARVESGAGDLLVSTEG